MQIIKREADADGRFLAPGGYGFSIRPGDGAAFPITVRPNGDPDAGILISDAGSLLMVERFGKLEIVDAPAGSAWEVTILEDLREWRTSQAQPSSARAWDTFYDETFATFSLPGTVPIAGYDADSSAWSILASADWKTGGQGVLAPLDCTAYSRVRLTLDPAGGGPQIRWRAALCVGSGKESPRVQLIQGDNSSNNTGAISLEVALDAPDVTHAPLATGFPTWNLKGGDPSWLVPMLVSGSNSVNGTNWRITFQGLLK